VHKSEFWISWRYFLGRNRERFVSIISIISILGVTVGVAALIIVLSVMTGFDNDLRDRIVGTNAHIVVSDNFGIMFYRDMQKEIERIPGVASTAPHINTQAFLRTDTSVLSLYLRGINPEEELKVTNIKKYLIDGSLETLNSRPDSIIIGEELADILGLQIGDKLELIAANLSSKLIFEISGIFKSGMHNYDLNLAFISLAKAQDISGVFNVAGGIGIKLDDLFSASRIKRDILFNIGTSYDVATWSELNKTFFDALKLEKITMFIILSLIVLVASFGIASTLIVTVTQKTKDIGILKSVGITKNGIRNIFTFQGLFIGIFGVGLGVLLGVSGSLLLKKYQFVKLPSDIYYLDKIPVYLSWHDISYVAFCAFLITLLATVYPAGKAANLNIVEALRYE